MTWRAWTAAVVGLAAAAIPPATVLGRAPDGAAAPATRLAIIYRPHGLYPKPGQPAPVDRWTLTCGPVGGTLPTRAVACRELAAHGSDLVHPGVQCMVIVLGGPSATVTGTWNGERVSFASSTCSRAWSDLTALLTGSTRAR